MDTCSVVRGKWRGFTVILGGILVHLTLGTIYTFGNMTPYITSYIRVKGVSRNLTYAESIWVFALAAMGQGSTVFFGGALHKRLGTQLTTLLGAWISSTGVALTYFTVKQSFAAFLITYGLMFGIGVGIAYAIPINCVMKWFPHHKGVVGGCVLAGFGGGAFIFDQVQTAYLNPSNLSPDLHIENDKYFTQKEVIDKVPYAVLLLGGIYASMQLIGVLLLKDPPSLDEVPLLPPAVKLDNTVHEENHSPFTNGLSTNRTITELSPRQLLKNRNFYILWLIFFFYGQGIQFISGLYKTYGQTFIKDDHFLAIVGSLAAVCNGLGRVMWGHLADKFSFKIAALISCSLFCTLMLTFIVTEYGGKTLFLIYVCLSFLAFSGNFSLLPPATAKSFGQEHYPMNYGMVFTASVITSPIGVILTAGLQSAIGWSGLFFLVSGFTFICILLLFPFNAKTAEGKDI